ncbi:MAG TPA: FkbM family methyltransferase [Chitinophagaceae bacterium]|nr:FkbM family methyltransferase [Chitinophagaceae bacterium]
MQDNSFVSNLYRGISQRLRGLVNPASQKAGLNWFKEKYLKHASSGAIRSYNYHQKKIYFINPSEFLHTLKEIFIHEIYKTALPPDAFIIDCGANIGLSTLYFKQLCPGAELIAFEPDDKNFALLEKNIRSFQLEKVQARKEAIWIEDTLLNFSGEGTMGSRIDNQNKTNTHTVKATRLYDLLDRPVDFLKIDIEGAEYAVVKDISPRLNLVKNLFLEYHGKFDQTGELNEIFAILQQAGFYYYIKEAAEIYPNPFLARKSTFKPDYDVQLNIFCFR